MKKKKNNNMKSKSKIHSLHALNNEIVRLKTEAGYLETRLEAQSEHLKNEFGTLCINTLCKRNNNVKAEENGNGSFHKNQKMKTFWSKVSDRIADRFGNRIDDLIDRLFEKKK